MTKDVSSLEPLEITLFDLGWCGGKIRNYRFEVSVSNNGSEIGINEGKILKLYLWDSEKGLSEGCEINYNRGWVIKPSKRVEPYFKEIMELFN